MYQYIGKVEKARREYKWEGQVRARQYYVWSVRGGGGGGFFLIFKKFLGGT